MESHTQSLQATSNRPSTRSQVDTDSVQLKRKPTAAGSSSSASGSTSRPTVVPPPVVHNPAAEPLNQVPPAEPLNPDPLIPHSIQTWINKEAHAIAAAKCRRLNLLDKKAKLEEYIAGGILPPNSSKSYRMALEPILDAPLRRSFVEAIVSKDLSKLNETLDTLSYLDNDNDVRKKISDDLSAMNRANWMENIGLTPALVLKDFFTKVKIHIANMELRAGSHMLKVQKRKEAHEAKLAASVAAPPTMESIIAKEVAKAVKKLSENVKAPKKVPKGSQKPKAKDQDKNKPKPKPKPKPKSNSPKPKPKGSKSKR